MSAGKQELSGVLGDGDFPGEMFDTFVFFFADMDLDGFIPASGFLQVVVDGGILLPDVFEVEFDESGYGLSVFGGGFPQGVVFGFGQVDLYWCHLLLLSGAGYLPQAKGLGVARRDRGRGTRSLLATKKCGRLGGGFIDRNSRRREKMRMAVLCKGK